MIIDINKLVTKKELNPVLKIKEMINKINKNLMLMIRVLRFNKFNLEYKQRLILIVNKIEI
jgi:hypothetical protein